MSEYKILPEVLAPAGEIKSVYGAFYAGADAVYLGAPAFSARAYAVNISIEDICEAIDYAHVFGKKVYLALNILLKNSEIEDALNLIKSLYENGLDAVIVQDLGLICLLKKHFPLLPVHASTQLAVMSSEAVKLLKEYGVVRVVPARELSIDELKANDETGVELECFVHGALCYSYSGKCLFSSIAGGRSGNRGRCAGPCRKSYNTYLDDKIINKDDDKYPLSMRDMCLISCVPELIEAGMDSFKIEGRMKAPEYASGVSAVYHKAIKDYAQKNKLNFDKEEKELRTLYMRAEVSTGYLHQHNGKDMISLKSPSYTGISDEKTALLRDKYIDKFFKKKINIYLKASKNEPLYICAYCDECSVEYYGQICEIAKKTSTDEASFIKQMTKLGDTFFEIDQLSLDIDDDIFVPVSAINEGRRQAVLKIRNELLLNYKRKINNFELSTDGPAFKKEDDIFKFGVTDINQLKMLFNYSFVNSIIIPLEIIENALSLLKDYDGSIFVRIPSVIRQNNLEKIRKILVKSIDIFDFSGVYVSSIDGLALAQNYFEPQKIYAEEGLYVFNDYTASELLKKTARYSLSFELNQNEIEDLSYRDFRELTVYGYIPLMYSAGCIAKSFSSCKGINSEGAYSIIDEGKRRYRVYPNHIFCYNTIYNNVPLSLLGRLDSLKKNKTAASYRVEFTIESIDETQKVLDMISEAIDNNTFKNAKFPANTFTAGHYGRGVV